MLVAKAWLSVSGLTGSEVFTVEIWKTANYFRKKKSINGLDPPPPKKKNWFISKSVYVLLCNPFLKRYNQKKVLNNNQVDSDTFSCVSETDTHSSALRASPSSTLQQI